MATPRLSTDDLCLLTNNLFHLKKFSRTITERYSFMGEGS